MTERMNRAGARPHSRDRTAPDDRILAYTKWLGAAIVPFLVAAWVLLYVFASDTEVLFAWTIKPSLTAMLLASAYAGGIWFFVLVARTARWHRVRHGYPAVFVFSSLAAIATVVHWDRFHFGHISFITWVTLYLTTPILVLIAWRANRRTDGGAPEAIDYAVPLPIRLPLAALGIAALVAGAGLFVFAGALASGWAWGLTPLTAKIVGAVLTLPGMVNIWLLTDSRWSAFRYLFQAQLVSLVFIIAALAIAQGDLEWGRFSAPLVVGGLVLSLVGYASVYVYCERELAKVRVAAGSG